jgi:hypothetical protein
MIQLLWGTGNAANPKSLAKLERYIIACTIDIKAQDAWLIGELDACKPEGFFDGSQGFVSAQGTISKSIAIPLLV